MDSLPDLRQSNVAKRYTQKRFLFLECTDIPETPAATYLFATLVMNVATKQPIACITAEVTGQVGRAASEHMGVEASPHPYIVLIDADGWRHNLGQDPQASKASHFFAKARKLLVEHLSGEERNNAPSAAQPPTRSGNSPFAKVAMWVFIVGIVGYMVYQAKPHDSKYNDFMLNCLGTRHSEAFCVRYWDTYGSKRTD